MKNHDPLPQTEDTCENRNIKQDSFLQKAPSNLRVQDPFLSTGNRPAGKLRPLIRPRIKPPAAAGLPHLLWGEIPLQEQVPSPAFSQHPPCPRCRPGLKEENKCPASPGLQPCPKGPHGPCNGCQEPGLLGMELRFPMPAQRPRWTNPLMGCPLPGSTEGWLGTTWMVQE